MENGFTLYSEILEDDPIDRFRILERVLAGEFDLIIFGDIWTQLVGSRSFALAELRQHANRGWCRHASSIPGSRTLVASAVLWGLPRAHRRFRYFKREWAEDTGFTPFGRLVPWQLRERSPHSRNLQRIGFSIPSEKIVATLPAETKEFPRHIVDAEVAARVPGAATSYFFSAEDDYYRDLQAARFGITGKRSGWECLRHYEIAANGAVPCFRDLDRKPANCAPHGLDDTNSIAYHSADELFDRLRGMSNGEYDRLQVCAFNWVREQTTATRARELIEAFNRNRAALHGEG